MSGIEAPAEAEQKLEEIQSKYDIFFRVTNKHILDYFELQFGPYATLKLKENCKVPFPMVNDLKEIFIFAEN
ncbi:hypothetical protein [Mucilaginibacter ginsenosidivorans]|uniref:Uncharacterized protein n=1 Tax=Mucilaginibacter ginsenosidivorans TaxID=398053 RepID=A0A5B8UX26_9SPHI|nr:hypothetical protein [Mucilaginibacter ginsenosidivorans]QEC63489.1 hypothetical protein FRZ54_13170 [Mucilaginibacter ginsenosidivorans]